MAPKLGVVLPCFNEEDIITSTATKLETFLNKLITIGSINSKSALIFIDDGSKDKTWKLITEIKESSEINIYGLKLSRNFGHQPALMAGLIEFKDSFDCIISIDADLQDDFQVIVEMINNFNQGSHIVYGVRRKRNVDSYFKRKSAESFYKLMKSMNIEIIYNHADFRLLSKAAIDALSTFKERNLFLRGIIPLLGFKYSMVYYDRKEREAGETKYPFWKMISFAIKGITAFSITPLRICFYLGLIICLFCIAFVFYAIYGYFFDLTIPGWTSTVIPIYLIGGIQLLSIGVLGEYVGKIYSEVKERPHYLIEEKL